MLIRRELDASAGGNVGHIAKLSESGNEVRDFAVGTGFFVLYFSALADFPNPTGRYPKGSCEHAPRKASSRTSSTANSLAG